MTSKNTFRLPKAPEESKVPLTSLFLDDVNPRFGGSLKGKTQEQIIDTLAEEKNLLELIESFRQNGYYNAEPLLVVEKKSNRGHYVVIEGNRRVAALKILFDLKLLKQYGFSDDNKFIPTGSIAEELQKHIPVQIYKNRTDLWSYLGFRHIKGAMPWDPYSKALFIVNLHDSGTTINEIVRRIGDQNALVVKMFNGIKVLQQASKEEFIDPQKLQKFSFSHLYTILGYTNTQKFLGLKIKGDSLLKENPVPSKNISNLKTLIEFIYGDVEGKMKPLIKSQNPDIRRLDAVLGETRATIYLKENFNQAGVLENAFGSTSAAEEIVPDLIAEAFTKLQKASGNIYTYKNLDPDTEKTLNDIKAISDVILDRFKNKNVGGKKKNKK